MNEMLDPRALAPDVMRAQNGDPNAMNRILAAVQDMVYYSCLRMLRNETEAQDASQDVLITIYQKIDSLGDPLSYLGWVKRIVANRCRDRLKKTNKEFLLYEDEEGTDPLAQYEDLDEQRVPDKALDNAETRRMINELIDRLPDEQRVCVILYYYNEMKTREIAEALHISEGTVKSRLNYARKAIKEGVGEYEKQGIKLYGLSPLLFLGYFLRAAGSAVHAPFSVSIPSAAAADAASSASAAGRTASAAGRTVSANNAARTASAAGRTAAHTASAAGKAAGAAAAGTAAKAAASAGFGAFLATTAGKIVAAAVVAAVLGGAALGTVFAVRAANEKSDRHVETIAQQPVISELPAEAEAEPASLPVPTSSPAPTEESLPIVVAASEPTPEPIPEPEPEAHPQTKLIASYSNSRNSEGETMFTCDLDGDGVPEEISFALTGDFNDNYEHLILTAGGVSYTHDYYLGGICYVQSALVVDLDERSPYRHLIVNYFEEFACNMCCVLHTENGAWVFDRMLNSRFRFTDGKLSEEPEACHALGTRGPGGRAVYGDDLTPESDWYELPLESVSARRKNSALHLILDLPCTIDGQATVIPAGSYVWYLGFKADETACKVLTEDGAIAIIELEPTGSWPIYKIAGRAQDDYFDNLEYYG